MKVAHHELESDGRSMTASSLEPVLVTILCNIDEVVDGDERVVAVAWGLSTGDQLANGTT